MSSISIGKLTAEEPMATDVKLISPRELAELCQQQQVKLIDVRTSGEFERVHACGATNIPLDQFDPAGVINDSEAVIYFICRAGSRAQKACDRLLAVNPNVRVVQVEG